MKQTLGALAVAKLAGTAGISDGFFCDEHGIDLEQLEELMLDEGYERCPECNWWVETDELVDDDSNTVPCSSCR